MTAILRIQISGLWILLWAIPISLIAQPTRFEQLGKEYGLPGGHTLCILQDSDHFLWIGTTDGLFRYDGKQAIEFRHNPSDSKSISNNSIRNLLEDKSGKIWIGTAAGLNCYDPSTEQFKRYTHFNNGNIIERGRILSTLEDRKGYLWFGTYNGLYRLGPERDSLLHFLPQEENDNSISDKVIWKIFEDQSGRLWFGTNNGLTIYNNDEQFKFKRYIPKPGNQFGLKTEQIWAFAQQPNGTIWLGSAKGIYRLQEGTEDLQFAYYGHDPNNTNSLTYDFVEYLIADGNERLWVSSWHHGLTEVRTPSSPSDSIKFIRHRYDPENEHGIGSDIIDCIYRDRNKQVWLGLSSGLNRVSNKPDLFQNLRHESLRPGSISNNIIKAVHRDSKGNLWVGTLNGLNFLSKENFELKNFDFVRLYPEKGNPHSLSHKNIFGIHEDSQQFLWIATYSGLNYIDLKKELKAFEFKKIGAAEGLLHTFTYSILEIEKGQYWISSAGGLSRLYFDPSKPSKSKYEHFEMNESRTDALINSMNYTVCKDRYGDYWIATFNGLSKYVERDGRNYFENYQHDPSDTNSLSSNSVIDLFRDSKDRLWVQTRGGLNLVQQASRDERATFRHFGIQHGFINDVIQGLEEDHQNRFWIGTNRGLMLFDPELALKNQKAVLASFDLEDGFAGPGVVFRSTSKDKDGNLFFGSAAGLNIFKAQAIQKNQQAPKIRFTKLEVLNETISPRNEKEAILRYSIAKTAQIKLKYWQNIIALEFAALEYTNPNKNQYRYQLKGFDENWVNSAHRNRAMYTNLPAGNYTFQVQGSNNDGVWSEAAAQLRISIQRPPWQTWWAYLVYFLLFSGGIYSFIQYRIRQRLAALQAAAQIEAARREERASLRRKNAADFHDDLGHQITKMSLYIELAERQEGLSGTTSQLLQKIKTNIRSLSEGVRDLIWSLDPQKDSLYQTLLRLQEFGDKLFDYSSIHFKTNGIDPDLEQFELNPDVRKQIVLIFKEIMHNCLKYSNATSATLSAQQDHQTCKLLFKDNGKGFDLNTVKNGYGLKNIQERAHKIDAELHINSTEGQGTHLELQLNLPHMGEGSSPKIKRTLSIKK